jgi:hypothetical protein
MSSYDHRIWSSSTSILAEMIKAPRYMNQLWNQLKLGNWSVSEAPAHSWSLYCLAVIKEEEEAAAAGEYWKKSKLPDI